MSHHTIPDHTCHFSHFILFVPIYFWIFRCTDPRKDCTSFHGKKGLKAQRLVVGKRKYPIINLLDYRIGIPRTMRCLS
jgi:hypothetical protein